MLRRMSVKPIELSEIEREQLKKGSDWRERERAQTILMLSEGQTVLTVAERQAGSDSRAATQVAEKRDGQFAGPTTLWCAE